MRFRMANTLLVKIDSLRMAWRACGADLEDLGDKFTAESQLHEENEFLLLAKLCKRAYSSITNYQFRGRSSSCNGGG
jgi:hypothetical protein